MDSRNIILVALHELYTVLAQILYGTGQKWQTLDELIDVIVEAVLRFARRLIERYVGEVNKDLFENRKLLQPSLLVKERHLKKTVVTAIGVLELPEDVYIDRETRKRVAPVLLKLGLKPHQKVTDG